MLSSGNYFARAALLENAEKSPEKIRELFENLFNEDLDLLMRVQSFQAEFKKIWRENFPGKKNDYQDHRAVMIYLTLRYSETYYFYKYGIFKSYVNKLGFFYKPRGGRIENISNNQSMCDLINAEILKDQELLKLHIERISDDCYFDINAHLLTHDFLFALDYYLSEVPTSFKKETKNIKFDQKPIQAADIKIATLSTDLKPSIVDHNKKAIENQRIGGLGEEWVLRFESERLKKLGKERLARKLKHISRVEGDGAGYDILSYEEDGNLRFIEVKTTIGKLSQPFYVTNNELQKSKNETDHYYLYRVYNYNAETNTADLEIIRGDLTPLCKYPVAYRVNIQEE